MCVWLKLLINWKRGVERIGREEAGVTLIYVALVFPLLLGLAGLAIDGSNLFAQQRRMQTAADAAALAGARIIALGKTTAEVNSEVNSLALTNGSDSVTWSYIDDGKGVQVQTTHTFPTYFAGALGYSTLTVAATAGANYYVVASAGNLMPMVTKCDDMASDTNPGFTYGAVYTLWSHDQTAPGNFGWVDWNSVPVGNAELADNIANPGNSGVWHIGDWIPAGPGVQNSAPVKQALNLWIGKAVTIPLYGAVTGTGANTRYQICTFAEFIMTGYDFSGRDKWIRGTFLRYLAYGGSDTNNPPDFGVYDVHFVQ